VVSQTAAPLGQMTRLDKALVSVIFATLSGFWIFTGWAWGEGVTALFLSSFVVQSLLLALYAKIFYNRLIINWSMLTLSMNISVFVLLEIHMPGRLGSDNIAELGTAIIITTVALLITLVIMQKESTEGSRDLLPLRLISKSFFRLWVVVSGAWVLFSGVAFYLRCGRYDCKIFVGKEVISLSYFDIGEWFVSIPALAFVLSVAACWTLDGFRRDRAQTGQFKS
jgi:hypothetical protein